MPLTTTLLLADIRRNGMLPASTVSATADADLLLHADAEMQSRLVPLLLRCNEEYLVRLLTQTLTAGQAAYPVPRRAVGARVRDVVLLSGSTRYHLPRLQLEQRSSWLSSATGLPQGFYLDAANVVLTPTPSAADTLEMHIYVRPGMLVDDTSGARAITAVTANADYLGTTGVTGRTRLQFASATLAGSTIDIIAASSPYEHKALDIAVASAGGAVTSIDVPTASLLATPAVGDWVTVTVGTSPVPQLPAELHSLLVQRVVARTLSSLGYQEEASRADATAAEMEHSLVSVLTPRTDGNPKRVTGGALALIRGR